MPRYIENELKSTRVMKHKIQTKSSFDGLPISIMEIRNTETPSRVLLFIHGLCGNKEKNTDAMNFFADHGFSCISYDLRGHGESLFSEKDRGYTNQGGATAMVQDMDSVIHKIRESYKDIPIYMIAHSMGSLAARSYLKTDDSAIKGLILCGNPSFNYFSPLGKVAMNLISLADHGRTRIGWIQELTSRIYNRQFNDEGKLAWTCSDPLIRERFRNDSTCNITITADCSLTILDMMGKAYSRNGWKAHNPSLPILLISGMDDPCMISIRRFHKSAGFFNTLGYTDVSGALVKDMRHEVLNEKGKEQVWEEILRFIDSHR